MMQSKRVNNVFFDFSFSLLYYRGSSVIKDLIYCMRSMQFERIFYGSDYPDRGVGDTLNLSLKLLKDHNIEEKYLHKLFYSNWLNIFDVSNSD